MLAGRVRRAGGMQARRQLRTASGRCCPPPPSPSCCPGPATPPSPAACSPQGQFNGVNGEVSISTQQTWQRQGPFGHTRLACSQVWRRLPRSRPSCHSWPRCVHLCCVCVRGTRPSHVQAQLVQHACARANPSPLNPSKHSLHTREKRFFGWSGGGGGGTAGSGGSSAGSGAQAQQHEQQQPAAMHRPRRLDLAGRPPACTQCTQCAHARVRAHLHACLPPL